MNTYKILFGKPEGERLHAKLKRRWEVSNRTNFRQIEWKAV
jgi:hypothetical protein